MSKPFHPTSPRVRGEGLAPERKASGAERSAGEGASKTAPHPDTPPHTVGYADSASPRTAGRGGYVLLGEFGRAHGLKGEVRLKSFTEDPKAIATYGPLRGEDGRSFTLKGVRPAGGGSPDLVIARVEGVATREAAEALNRIRLYAPRERLHGTESENEFLLADLIGLMVKDQDGAILGTVAAVPNYGGGDLLEIAPQAGGPTALLPFTEAFVPVVDVAGGCVVVDAPDDLFSRGTRADV